MPCGAAIRRRELCQAKVEDLYTAVLNEKKIIRLEVAMDDAFLMRCGNAAGHLSRNVECFARRERATSQPLAECFPFEQFGNNVRRAVMQPNVVDGEDVRMI